MKSILKIFFALMLFSSIGITQDNFHNIYSELGVDSRGLKIKNLGDGSFLLLGFVDSILTEIYLNTDGYIEHTVTLPFRAQNISCIDFMSDGGYAVLTKKENANIIDYFLTVLNSNKVIVLDKLIHTQLGLFVNASIISTRENNILISYIDSGPPSSQNLIYLNTKGKILWQNSISSVFSRRARYPLLELKDSTFLAALRNTVIKFDQNGDSLWSYKTNELINDLEQFKLNDDIIIGSSNSIIKVNADGFLVNLLENTEFREPSSISTFNDHSIVVFTADKYFMISPTFQIIGEVFTKINTINSLTDGDIFYGLGSLEYTKYYRHRIENISLIRWNKNNFPSKTLFLISPNGGEFFPTERNYNLDIRLYSEGLSSIKIELSTDGGSKWKVLDIIDSTQFEALRSIDIPYLNSDDCLVRISDANDPSLFDISTNTFSIRAYKYVDFIAGNECFMWIGNNGLSAHNPNTDDSGFYWPGGEEATTPAVFVDGIIWGGIHEGMIKVNGSTYRYGLTPGAILSDGTADDPKKSENSIFKLKKDWQSLPPGEEKDVMQYNYNNWPGEQGAPFEDVNSDGVFTKGVDVPKILGEETLFYVSNDLDSSRTAFTYGSPPIGLEFQQTLFAYNTPELKDAVFKKVRLINKSDSPIDSMYIGYWSDDDLGFAADDFAGCDTTLNMMYTYNGDNYDDNEEYNYGNNPPAVGRVLLQGPKLNSYSIIGSMGEQINTPKALGITSCIIHIKTASDIFGPAELGTYRGALEYYNLMSGLLPLGDSLINPVTELATVYMLNGDPVEGIGWYEGEGWPGGPVPYDRNASMSSGPFTMAPGDTQEVVYATFMARGSSNIQSVAELKKTARLSIEFWGNDIPVSVERSTDVLPNQFSLSQNYPNPFNPTTTIKYSIPSSSVMLNSFQHLNNSEIPNPSLPDGRQVRDDNANVELVVYDILGRKVKTLVNQKQAPGNYEVEFNASKLSSGIYFYQLKTTDFVKVKKMIYLK